MVPDATNNPPVTGTIVKKKKTVHTSPPPLLPKRDEGVLLEILRNISKDIQALCDGINQLNAELDAKDKPNDQDKAMMRAMLKQMATLMDQVMALNTTLVEAQTTQTKDIIKWALWIATCALMGAGVIKIYTGWPG